MNLRERETTGQGPTCLPAVTRAAPSREGHGACAAPLVVRPGHRAASGGGAPGRPLPPTGGSGGSALGGPSLPQMGAAAPGPRTGAAAAPWLGASRRREQWRCPGSESRRVGYGRRRAEPKGRVERHGTASPRARPRSPRGGRAGRRRWRS